MVLVAMCALLFLPWVALAEGEQQGQAGLIVDYGNGAQSYVWVPFEGESISMTEMLEQSDLDTVLVSFGSLGNAVCKIEATGCDPSACRRLCQTKSSDPFWHILWLDTDTWRMTATGADGTRVEDGEVVALSWSSNTPHLPVMSVDEIAAKVGVTADPPDSPVTQTFGEIAMNEDNRSSWVNLVGSVGVVLIVAGGLIFRARRQQKTTA